LISPCVDRLKTKSCWSRGISNTGLPHQVWGSWSCSLEGLDKVSRNLMILDRKQYRLVTG
jgi:hypothetical protein